jgi:hypothetical protein
MKNLITTVVMTVALTGLTGTVFADSADEQLIKKEAQTTPPPISKQEADKNITKTPPSNKNEHKKSSTKNKMPSGMTGTTW